MKLLFSSSSTIEKSINRSGLISTFPYSAAVDDLLDTLQSRSRLSTRGFVKFLQEAALLNLLQETGVGNIGGLQRSGLCIGFAIEDRLNRLFHR